MTSHYDQFLAALQGPLDNSSEPGKIVKQLMLSHSGPEWRKKHPKFLPWCSLFPHGVVILSDGKVTTCCLDTQGLNNLGNVFEQDLSQLWANNITQVVKSGLYSLHACRTCIGNEGAPSLISDPVDYQVWTEIFRDFPRNLTLEIMGACNYGCCVAPDIHKYRSTTKLDLHRLFPRIKPALGKIENLLLFNYGEPLLNPGFCDFIANCRRETDTMQMVLATNGLLMDEKIAASLIKWRVDSVIVSVHGGPGTANMLKYAKYGADYEQVLTNVAQLLALRNQNRSAFPKISLRAILFDWNDTDELMNQFREDAAHLGLSAAGGDYRKDNYHWILDGGYGRGARSSRRFALGNRETADLIQSGELALLFRGYKNA